MKAFLAIFVYLVMAAILGGGVLLAVIKGSFWLLIVGLLAFIVAITKIDILHH